MASIESSKVVVLSEPNDCRQCPVSLFCLAGRSLNHMGELYNDYDVSGCLRCNAVHFHIDDVHHICTNIRDGLHPRVHPLFPVWDPDTESDGGRWVMGAIADDDGNCSNTPEHMTCAKHFRPVSFKKFDCAVMHKTPTPK